jgi:hypothetical protein
MVFGEDGSLLVGHGPAEDPLWLHSGQYAVDTGVLTFLDGWDNVCPDNPEQTGRYQVRLLNKNESMYLDVIEELCLTRDEVFHGLRWDRADMPRLP